MSTDTKGDDWTDSARLRLLIAQLEDAASHFDKHGLETGLAMWKESSVASLLRRLAEQAKH